jgi:hypothetical protein
MREELILCRLKHDHIIHAINHYSKDCRPICGAERSGCTELSRRQMWSIRYDKTMSNPFCRICWRLTHPRQALYDSPVCDEG